MIKLELQSVLGLIVHTEDGFVEVGNGRTWTREHEARVRQVIAAALKETPNAKLRDQGEVKVAFGPEFYFGRPVAVETSHFRGIVAHVFVQDDKEPRELARSTKLWSPPPMTRATSVE